jgi:hypothetical protein
MERRSEGPESKGRPPAERLSLEAIAVRLAALDAGQAAMNGALGLMLDTLHVQTNLLRKLAEFAAEDAAPSPLLKTLQELTAAIMDLDASVGDVERKFDELARILTVTFAAPLGEEAPGQDMRDWPHAAAADDEGG